MDPTTREALTNPESWKRGAVMLLFFLLLVVITPLLILVSIVGWVFLLVQGQVPESIRSFGRSLAAWYAQTARYLAGDARRRPFPFEDLDCVTDEPFSPPPSYRSPAERSRRQGKASIADEKAEVAAAGAGGKGLGQSRAVSEDDGLLTRPAPKKSASKKAGKKKSSKKKSSKKRTARKKAAGKKSDGRNVPGQAAGKPVAPTPEQET